MHNEMDPCSWQPVDGAWMCAVCRSWSPPCDVVLCTLRMAVVVLLLPEGLVPLLPFACASVSWRVQIMFWWLVAVRSVDVEEAGTSGVRVNEPGRTADMEPSRKATVRRLEEPVGRLRTCRLCGVEGSRMRGVTSAQVRKRGGVAETVSGVWLTRKEGLLGWEDV